MLSHLHRIDIEFHSKCNRRCDWCPNKIFDRHSQDIVMDKELFTKLIQELYDNNFGINTKHYASNSGNAVISFLGQAEPLLQIDTLKEYCSIVKKIFKKRDIMLLTNTNGDLLSPDKLENLPISILNVMDYDCKGADYWRNKLAQNNCVIIQETPHTISAMHHNVNLIQVSLNWPKHHQIEDRGGSLKPSEMKTDIQWKDYGEKRNFICYEPRFFINVCYDGSVMPCCHMRPDNPEHQEFILGNIKENTLCEILYSEKAVALANLMLSEEFDKYPAPCRYCTKTRNDRYLKNLYEKNDKYVKKAMGLSDTQDGTGIQYIKNRQAWTDAQVNCWDYSKYFYKREIVRDGLMYPNSLYNNRFNNIYSYDFIKTLYDNICYNWEQCKQVYDYQYIDMTHKDFIDLHNGIGFDNFSFTADSMCKEFLEDKGFYQPFLAFKHYFGEDPEISAICGGRHRLVALGQLRQQKILSETQCLCLFLDDYKQNFKVTLQCPSLIYHELAGQLQWKEVFNKGQYYELVTDNVTDIWMLMKFLEKELDFYVEYYTKEMKADGILPNQGIINIQKSVAFDSNF